MAETIEVKLTDQRCALGDAYARKHLTSPPKTAVLSCEGMCLRGEVARRAANLIAHQLAPETAVRICHGGLLESSSGMRDLVERANRVLMLDGCFLACGTRLLRGALPQVKPVVVFTDRLFDSGEAPFGVEEVEAEVIEAYAREVAKRVMAEQMSGSEAGDGARADGRGSVVAEEV